MKRRLPGYCTLCRSRCGTLNTVENDRLVAVTADPDHPTGQATCAKGRAAPELVHSRERILYPLKRSQPKGAADPGWQRISWDEALTEIADKLAVYRDRHGAESVAFSVTTPSGTPMSDSIDWVERFIRRYGIDTLRPKRVEPVTPAIVEKCLALARAGGRVFRGAACLVRATRRSEVDEECATRIANLGQDAPVRGL